MRSRWVQWRGPSGLGRWHRVDENDEERIRTACGRLVPEGAPRSLTSFDPAKVEADLCGVCWSPVKQELR